MSHWLQLLFFIPLLVMTGCRQEEPNPENLDPIYAALVKQEKEDEGKIEAEKKRLESARVDFSLADPLTIEKKTTEREVARAERSIYILEQKRLYEHIRTERRRVEDRNNYQEAFAAGREWPSKAEYQEFVTNQRLRMAPRQWDAHIPRLFERKPAATSKNEASATKEE